MSGRSLRDRFVCERKCFEESGEKGALQDEKAATRPLYMQGTIDPATFKQKDGPERGKSVQKQDPREESGVGCGNIILFLLYAIITSERWVCNRPFSRFI